MQLRQQLNAGLAKDGKKLSVNDFVIKASAAVRIQFPPECLHALAPMTCLQHDVLADIFTTSFVSNDGY